MLGPIQHDKPFILFSPLYQLFDRIGAGGMAEIYLSRARTELGGARLVVVKQILPDRSMKTITWSHVTFRSRPNNPTTTRV